MQKSENNPRWKQIGWVLHWVSIDCVPRFVSVGVCFFPACYMLTPHLMSLFLLTVLFVFFFSILTLVAETTTCIITWFDACVSKKKNLIFFFKFFWVCVVQSTVQSRYPNNFFHKLCPSDALQWTGPSISVTLGYTFEKPKRRAGAGKKGKFEFQFLKNRRERDREKRRKKGEQADHFSDKIKKN